MLFWFVVRCDRDTFQIQSLDNEVFAGTESGKNTTIHFKRLEKIVTKIGRPVPLECMTKNVWNCEAKRVSSLH